MIQLRDYQQAAVDWLGQQHRGILADEVGLGKAQPIDANVLTPSGWKKIGDVVIGDSVVGSDGLPTSILGVYPQGERPIYRVFFSDGSSVECDEEHLWCVQTKNDRSRNASRILPLSEIRHTLSRDYFIPMVAPVEFEGRPLPLDPWLLGYLIGNGCLLPKRVLVSTADVDALEAIKQVLPEGAYLSFRSNYDWSIIGDGKTNPVLTALRDLGLSGKLAGIKFVPDLYKLSSVASRIALLQGLLDSDGHVRPLDNNVEFGTASPRLADDVVFLIRSLGGTAKVRIKQKPAYTYNGQTRYGQPCYRMSVILPENFAPFRLSKKASVYHPREKYPPARRIVDVEYVGEKPAVCLRVSASDSLYVTEDFVVTHNTFPLIKAAYEYLHEPSSALAPIMVVCPPYLMYQWVEAIRAMYPLAEVAMLHRNDARLMRNSCEWIIIGYHTLMHAGLKKHPELLEYTFPVIIFDETHRLRGRNSQWTKNAYKLKAEKMFFATGTPVVKDPGDIFPLLKLCDPKKFSSYWRFVNEYCYTVQTPWATEIHGIKPGLEDRFHQLLDAYMLRRRIEDHLPELPPVIEHRITVDLPPAVKKAHDSAKRDWFLEHESLDAPVAITSGGALVTKLRQYTAGYINDGSKIIPVAKENPKIDAVKELLDDHPNEPVLVFCWYVGTANLIADAIDTTGRTTWLITGHSPPEDRARMVEDWKMEPNGVIVATLASMTEGVNLQHAKMVVFAEHDYLPATIEQATARVRRFGQEYPVNVYHVVAKGTVDESVMKIWTKRGASIQRALLEDLRDGKDTHQPLVPGRLAFSCAA